MRFSSGFKLSVAPLLVALPGLTSMLPRESSAKRDIKWVEGMRGLAAMSVVSYHMCLGLDPTLVWPQDNEITPPRLWQLPFFRAIISGRASVSLFFVLTGLTNVVRSIKLTHAGDTDSAYRGLARSAAKRVAQLVLPTAAATVLNWFLCQIGVYKMAAMTEPIWLRSMTPQPSVTLLSAVTHLFTALRMTWTREANYYGPEQWCMMRLLEASMAVYLVMLATIRCQPVTRMTLIMGLVVYSILKNDTLVGINAYSGMILAELSLLPGTFFTSTSPSTTRTIVAGSCFILGLYLASYPDSRAELSAWSMEIAQVINSVFPLGIDHCKLSNSLGVIFVMYGVLLSSYAKKILSHPICCKLGQLSMGIFLLHMAVIRTVFTWILFGLFSSKPVDPLTGLPNPLALYAMPAKPYRFVAAIITLGVVVYVSDLWHKYLDPWFAWGTEKVDELIFSSDMHLVLPTTVLSTPPLRSSRSMSSASTIENDWPIPEPIEKAT